MFFLSFVNANTNTSQPHIVFHCILNEFFSLSLNKQKDQCFLPFNLYLLWGWLYLRIFFPPLNTNVILYLLNCLQLNWKRSENTFGLVGEISSFMLRNYYENENKKKVTFGLGEEKTKKSR